MALGIWQPTVKLFIMEITDLKVKEYFGVCLDTKNTPLRRYTLHKNIDRLSIPMSYIYMYIYYIQLKNVY